MPLPLNRLSNWSIGTKFSVFTFALVASIFAIFIFFISQASGNLVEKRTIDWVSSEAKGVANSIEVFNRAQLSGVEKFSKIFASEFSGDFAIVMERQVDTGGTITPVLQNNGADLNLDFSKVDKFTRMTGGNATVFVKKGDDFVRIATSVKKADGNRAVGTMLDRSHPAYVKMLGGQPYKGLATLFGKPYVTEYIPVRDAQNKVVGILFVGIDISADVTALQEKISSLTIGKSGYYFVLDAKEGDTKGTFLTHPTMQGKNVLDARDTNGREFIKEMLTTKQGSLRYSWSGQADQRERLVVYETNEEWKWVIGGLAFTDEVIEEIVDLRNTSFIAGLIALLGFATIFFFIVRNLVAQPLKTARDAANRLAQGDLTVSLEAKNQDEIGQLVNSMNGISTSLTEVITSIREGSEQVATASGQIASGNLDLSARTEEQASSLEETAASMEEITSTVRQNADNARQANQLAATASSIAAKGGNVVAQVVDTMGSINDSSRRIVDIIAVIDGIAFQTNILALNAAVEAARAGEQGKGFAVVASEVRSLAQRSAAAAKEIKSLIDDSVSKVNTGSHLVAQAGSTMNEIMESVQKVTDIMADITAATQEQSAGIEEVNRAISQMDQVTQQNASLVEEAAAAAESMQEQAAKLARLVSTFKVNETRASLRVSSRVSEPALTASRQIDQPVQQRKAPTFTNSSVNGDWEEF